MKWVTVYKQLFHESDPWPVAEYPDAETPEHTAEYLNNTPLLGAVLLALHMQYESKTEDYHEVMRAGSDYGDYEKGWALGLSFAMNQILDQIEELLKQTDKNRHLDEEKQQ